MKLYGSLSRLVAILFRKDGFDITTRPNQATTYTANRDVQLPAGDTAHVLVSRTSTDTLTNKSIDADTNTITNIDNNEIKAAAAIDATKIANGSVSNTEFQYLDGVTSAIQTQIDSKVTGPASATDNALSRFDGTTGKLVQNSTATLSDTGDLAIASGSISVDNLSLDANTLASTNTNGDISLDPNGTGAVSVAAAHVKLQSGTSASELRFYEPSGSGTNYSAFKAQAQAGDVTYTLPPADATVSGYVLSSNASGSLSWVSNASSSSFATDWLTADGTTKSVTHSLGSRDVIVQIYDGVTYETIEVDSEIRTDANTVDLSASEAPGTSWRVMILKI